LHALPQTPNYIFRKTIYKIPLQGETMAVGWSRDGSEQEQIDASVAEAVELARSRLPEGKSAKHCEVCEEAIPEARRKAIPGVRLCVGCQGDIEKRQVPQALYNRRGSKDSQLK
jgi:phage/conjugal plasmid C-4 type zinc finger TraR family protein